MSVVRVSQRRDHVCLFRRFKHARKKTKKQKNKKTRSKININHGKTQEDTVHLYIVHTYYLGTAYSIVYVVYIWYTARKSRECGQDVKIDRTACSHTPVILHPWKADSRTARSTSIRTTRGGGGG